MWIEVSVKSLTCLRSYQRGLKQIRHYLATQSDCTVTCTKHLLSVATGKQSCLILPMLPQYFHDCWLRYITLHSLSIAYDCLLILKTYFPAEILLRLQSESNAQMVEMQMQRNEQFSRRVNSQCKALLQCPQKLTAHNIASVLYFVNHHYTPRNQLHALRVLASARPQQLCYLSPDLLTTCSKRTQLKCFCDQLSLHMLNEKKQEVLAPQTTAVAEETEYVIENPKQVNTALFQLRETRNGKRLCNILRWLSEQNGLSEHSDGEVAKAIQRFLQDQFHFSTPTDLLHAANQYWLRRGKPLLTLQQPL